MNLRYVIAHGPGAARYVKGVESYEINRAHRLFKWQGYETHAFHHKANRFIEFGHGEPVGHSALVQSEEVTVYFVAPGVDLDRARWQANHEEKMLSWALAELNARSGGE